MPRVKIGSFIDPMHVDQTVRRAKVLEEAGFDSVWLSDETLVFNSPPDLVVPELFPALAMVAGGTKKVKIGTGVIDASIRHPAKTAQSVVTIDEIAHGRLMIGIGGGEAGNRDAFGMPLDHPCGRMEEAVKIMKLLFGASHKKPVSFSGRFYSLRDAYLKIRPTSERGPPIIVSAFGPRALRLAGAQGDGWLSFSHIPESYRETLEGPVRGSAKEAGRDLRDFITTLVVPVALSRNAPRVNKTLAAIAKDWMVWSPDNMKLIAPDVSQPVERQPYAKKNDRESIRRLAGLASEIPDEIALQTAAGGTVDQTVEQLERFVRAGVRRFIFYVVPIETGWSAAVREVSRRILPHFS